MKTYLKPDIEVTDVSTRQVFTLDAYSAIGGTGTIHTKRNDSYFEEYEGEDDGLW